MKPACSTMLSRGMGLIVAGRIRQSLGATGRGYYRQDLGHVLLRRQTVVHHTGPDFPGPDAQETAP